MVCWGRDSFGEASPPESVNGTAGSAIAIAAGDRHSCAIESGTGAVVCWGSDTEGQASPPESVDGSAGSAIAIAVGDRHSCAIESGTGAVVCWGSDTEGQVSPPESVDGSMGSASAVAAGGKHSCAIESGSGAVVCWGSDSYGQVIPPASVDGSTGSASAIAAGGIHSCAIQSGTGAVICWGFNRFSQANPPASVDGSTGSASAIAAGGIHSCAIQSGSGAVVCWGDDRFSQASTPASVDGTTGGASAILAGTFHSCAIQSGSGAVVCWGDDSEGQGSPPAPVDGGAGSASAIAAGGIHSCAIQSGSGAVVCWGDDSESQASPPASVDGTTGGAIAIAAGIFHTCAIESGSGAVVCWGDDSESQASPPASVDGSAGSAIAIAAGNRHSCAIESGTGAVVCWGDDSDGQASPPSSVDGSTGSGGASAIAAGELHSCAIQSGSGAVVCWGNDFFGQASPPASVDGSAGSAIAIAAGPFHSCAIESGSGAVVCWGSNNAGRASPPASVDGSAGSAIAIAAGPFHSCAIQSGTGAVVCWGDDFSGQASPPASVDGSAGSAIAIASGGNFSLAIAVPEPGCTTDGGCVGFVTFVNPGSNSTQQSFLRFVSKAATPTNITIQAFDDDGFGAPGGTVETTLDPFASLQLTSQDLEQGNAAKGMSGSLGDGTGKWQLEVRSNTDIEVMSMIRTPDGFLTSVSDVVPKNSPNEIYFANPASNQNQQSFLRFTNQSDVGGFVTLSGVDDNGNPAPGTDITFSLFARESKQLNSRDIENGNSSKGLSGALGDGSGKWHLTATSDVDLEVMSLIRTPDGFLTNLSGVVPTDTQNHRIYYANPASETGQVTFIRIVNSTASTGTVTISGIDDNGDAAPGGVVQFQLGPLQAKQLLAADLENGNADKGLTGALGKGAGKWQLTVTADMDIAVMNLIRTADGFLTNLSQVAPKSILNTTEVYLLNPGSNTNQRSLLRVVNTTGTPGTVAIRGVDDNGKAASGGSVSFQIAANRGLVLTAQDIENGNASKGLSGPLGDGVGKWHLTLESTVEIAVMSLLDTPNGFITDLSRPGK